jgi:hypothetical protein
MLSPSVRNKVERLLLAHVDHIELEVPACGIRGKKSYRLEMKKQNCLSNHALAF